MTNKQGDFIWYELITEDAGAAAEFYERVVGWRTRPAGMGPDSYRIFGTGERDVGGMMDTPADAKSAGMKPVWLGYVAVPDVDTAVSSIESAGGTRQMGPMDIPGVGRFAMVSDPQGAAFYVMRGAVEEGISEAFSPDRVGHCNWNELSTADQAGAWDFYGRQFGWKKGDVMPMGPMGDYEFLDHAGVMIGAFMRAEPGGRSRWRFYFGVDDIDRATVEVGNGGGTIMHGPAEIPGGSFIIIAADPQGAEFGLVGPRKS